jgi:PAS domain-containing protein
MKWAEKTAEGGKDTLIHLLRKYQIQPYEILEILALYKSEEWFHTHLNVRRKLRSAALREKDAKVLDKAVCILNEWREYLTYETHAIEVGQYPEGISLIAKTLRDLGPSQEHRATEVRLRCCAQRLAQEFRNHTGRRNPLYKHIGVLVKSAFPKDWGAGGDLREAAKKLVKGWDYAKRQIDECSYPIWILDNQLKIVHVNQPAGRLLGVRPWEASGKKVDFLIKPLLAKLRADHGSESSSFQRAYFRILQGKGFELKTTLKVECPVTNTFHEKTREFRDYDLLVQHEIGAAGRSVGTRTYLTEQNRSRLAAPPEN